jgi:uncharacterized protein YjaG (DUF416 family)
MNHEKVHENITDEHDALWEAISQLEDAAKDQLKQIEDLRKDFHGVHNRPLFTREEIEKALFEPLED